MTASTSLRAKVRGTESPALLTLLLVGACHAPTAPPEYRFAKDGEAMQPDFVAVEGDGERPVPGDVLRSLSLVLDDVAEQVFEQRSGGQVYRRTNSGVRLVALEVDAASDLATLTDVDIAALRGIHFERWGPAIANELGRVDARRCMFSFGPTSNPVDVATLPVTSRYLDMRYAEPVDPAGFARFTELRYLAVPNEAFVLASEPLPEASVAWTRDLPELRWLDLGSVSTDLSPLAGHRRLHTVFAAHCCITRLPRERMPALREFLAPFSDCPDAEVDRLRTLDPAARIRTTPREMLLDCAGTAKRLQLRTGASCHPRPSDHVVYETEDAAEIRALLELLQPHAGFARHTWISVCDRGVMQFFGADGSLLAEVGMLGTTTLRSYRAWDVMPAQLASTEGAAALKKWLVREGSASASSRRSH